MPNLTNSTTSVQKVTHVPLKPPTPTTGWATVKSSFVRQLGLQTGEVTAVQQAFGTLATAAPNAITPISGLFCSSLRARHWPRSCRSPLPLPVFKLAI